MAVRGYRTEGNSVIGLHDLLKITHFEIVLSFNNDISRYIQERYGQSYKPFLQSLYNNGYKKAIWLHRTPQDVIDNHCGERGIEYRIEEYKLKYGIVISDSGYNGFLVAYKGKPIIKFHKTIVFR